MKNTKRILCALGLMLSVSSVWAAAVKVELADVDIDKSYEAAKRGAETVTTLCMSCHSLKYIRYKHLMDIGYTEDEVNALRGANSMEDPLTAMMPPEGAKAAFGMVPPDLSLMGKARAGGALYVYTLMAGYYSDENDHVDNHAMPGTKMPDVFGYAALKGADREAAEQKIHDIASFLHWTADPKEKERHELGKYVLGYLVLLSILAYLLKKAVWARIKGRTHPWPDQH